MELPTINDRDWFSREGMERIKADIKAKIEASGEHADDEIRLFFAVENGWMQALNEKPTYRERHDAWRAKNDAKFPPVDNRLDAEERAYIIDRLHGANDPIGQSIIRKMKV